MTKLPKKKRSFASHFWRLIRFGLALFLAFNVYALALRFIAVPTTILMVQRGLAGEDIRRDWASLSEISPYVVQAVMAGEDSRFCEHEGIDWDAIEQAFEDNHNGGKRRGGSTITQQTAKNVFFWNGGGYVRKAGEAWFANLIDYTWGKSRVMEVYLNVAEWGDGIFGVEAAAQSRFGKSAKDVSRQEAALLAAVLPSPNKWRLDPPSDFVRGRAGTLRQRMAVIRDSGYDKCVLNLAEVKKTVPKTPIQEPPEEAPPIEAALDDVLKAAEDAVEESRDEDIEETDMPARPPTEIPPVDPSTIPATPDEIAPDREPEIPQESPQEIPIQTPPTEVPQQPEEFKEQPE